MKITKLKHKDEQTEVQWDTINGEDHEHHSLSCRDEPSKPFTNAMKNLEGDVVYLLELDGNAKKAFQLTGISVDEDKHGNRGFVFSGRCKVSAGTYSISTPRMREPSDEVPTGSTVLTPEQVKRVTKLMVEGLKFIDGNRSQRTLPLEETEPAGAAK